MNVIEFSIENTPNIQVEALCIGKFDGIHLGHQLLIQQTQNIGGNNSGIVTFNPLPFVFFGKSNKIIYTIEEKISIFQNLNIHKIFIINFNNILINYNVEAFLEKISKITKNIIVGEDFRFGKNQSANIETLIFFEKKYGYKTHIMKKISNSIEKISSSQLKFFIENANFTEYNKISSIPFHTTGNVQYGKQIAGNLLKFPTANIIPLQEKIMPPFGVYVTLTENEGNIFHSISNYGIKPTISDANLPTLETHLFNYDGNLYGKKIKIIFLKKLRDEIKFDNINQLKSQINQDITLCKEFHSLYENNKT